MRGADAVVKILEAEGVDRVWGTIGHASFELADALLQSDQIITDHATLEYAGVFMAEAYNKAHGRVKSVVMGTAASGLMIISGIANSFLDSVPMVAIVGSHNTNADHKSPMQYAPSAALAAPVTKWSNRVIRGDSIPEVIRKAFRIANSGRPGPVVIELPLNLAVEKFEYKTSDFDYQIQPKERPRGDAGRVQQSINLLLEAKRPAILAGGGVVSSGAFNELKELVEYLGVPVATTAQAKGAVGWGHEQCLGNTGVFGSKYANQILNEADVLLSIGCRFAEFGYSEQWSIPAQWKLIHVDIDSNEIGKIFNPAVGINGDAKAVLIDMLEAAKDSFKPQHFKDTEWYRHAQDLRNKWPAELEQMITTCESSECIHPGRFFQELRKVLQPDAMILTEPTSVEQWALQCFSTDLPNTHFSPNGYAHIGWAVPSAVGAKLAEPQRQIVSISGDWSFHYSIPDIPTVLKTGAPVINVVFNDSMQICNVFFQQACFGDKSRTWVDQQNPDFQKLAESFGIKSAQINTVEEIQPVFEKALSADEPFLVEVKIDSKIGGPAVGKLDFHW